MMMIKRLLVLLLAVVLLAGTALADSRGLSDGVLPIQADVRWHPNFDGTHSSGSRTVRCDREFVRVGNTTVTVCPVCGDMNGTEILPVMEGRHLQVVRIDSTEVHTATGLSCLNGRYLVRMAAMPDSSDIAYVITFCHEVDGVAVNADAIYYIVLPIRLDGMTVRRACFGGLRDMGRTEEQKDGLHIIPDCVENTFGMYVVLR